MDGLRWCFLSHENPKMSLLDSTGAGGIPSMDMTGGRLHH